MTKNGPKIPFSLPPIGDKLRKRLANGARLRAQIQEQIERGRSPAPAYRVEWLYAPLRYSDALDIRTAPAVRPYDRTHQRPGRVGCLETVYLGSLVSARDQDER